MRFIFTKSFVTEPVHTNMKRDMISASTKFSGITVKTSPCQNVPELVKTCPKVGQNVPMVKHVGQNVPKMIFLIYFMYFRHNLGCLNETVLDIVFLSRFHSVISVK